MVLVKELEDPTPPNNMSVKDDTAAPIPKDKPTTTSITTTITFPPSSSYRGNSPTISASNEWSPLHTLLIGRASHSLFPSEPPHMIRATMPSPHHHLFYPHHRFPASIVAKADEELDNFARVMTEKFGIKVYRPREVDWDNEANGYTGAMPRDGLMVVGRTVVEACFAWGCRREEVDLAFGGVLEEIQVQVVREVKEKEKEKEKEEKEGEGAGEEDVNVRICRAPKILGRDTIYDGLLDEDENGEDQDVDVDGNIDHGPCAENGVVVRKKWAINNTRPAFDCADFMRFGTVLIGQLSHVTNPKGVDYLRAVLPSPYTVELLNTTDDHAMHIDATILPLRHGTLIYCPLRVTEEELRRHEVFRDWELRPLPWNPEEEEEEEDGPPMYMCSKWLVLNALSVNETTIVVEERQERFARWLEEEFGMEVVRLPFRHVNSLGGSFHCATVDLVRGEF